MNQDIIPINNNQITALGVEAILDFYKTIGIDQLTVVPGLNAFVTGVPSTSLNVVIDTRKTATFNDEIIQSITNFFGKYHVPWAWFITAVVEKNDISQHGFHLTYQTPGMVFDLNQTPAQMGNMLVSIKETDDDLKEWAEPIQEGFPSHDHCETYRQLYANLSKKRETRLRHFTAYYENEPAVSGTLFLSDKAVMLHDLATKIKFRKQGIASQLTVHMLWEAKKLGYQYCYLDTSLDALNLYRKIGFKTYCFTYEYEKIK